MADQHRWFKLWHSALSDDGLLALPPALRWAWAVFGCHTKVHGTQGVVVIRRENAVLAAEMGVPVDRLLETLVQLPGLYLGTAPVRFPHGHEKSPVCAGEFVRGSDPLIVRGSHPLEEWCTRHGSITVTWRNWTKYQEDSTVAQRGYASRSKRRREEKRGEKTNPPSVLRTESPPSAEWPESLRDVREWLIEHDAPAKLHDPAYWHRIDDWLGAPDSGVGYLDELASYLAWLAAQPRSRAHVDLKRGFRKWLAKSAYWSQSRAQTEAQRRARR